MKLVDARRWLAIYFLLITVVLGGYLLVAGGHRSWLLPLSDEDSSACFEIIIPVFIGQLAVIFQWIAQLNVPQDINEICPMPSWAIKLPPILISLLLTISLIILVAGNANGGHDWGMPPETFKKILTFCVSILNATTVFLVAKLFHRPQSNS